MAAVKVALVAMVEAIVAKGRTVHLGSHGVGHTDDVAVPSAMRAYGPGERVRVNPEDATRLRVAGFLVDAHAVDVPAFDGATVETAGGPSVTAA